MSGHAVRVLLAAGLVLTGCGSPDLGPLPSTPPPGYQPVEDVQVTSCGVQLGRPAANLVITNSTGLSRVYEVVVALQRDGERIGELRAAASALQPGETVRPTAFTVDDEVEGGFSCQLASVRSYPAPQPSQEP